MLDPVARGDTTWTALGLNHDGTIHARLVSAVMGVPMVFGTDHVVLKHEDADGVVSLVRYPIRPALQ